MSSFDEDACSHGRAVLNASVSNTGVFTVCLADNAPLSVVPTHSGSVLAFSRPDACKIQRPFVGVEWQSSGHAGNGRKMQRLDRPPRCVESKVTIGAGASSVLQKTSHL